MADRGLIRHVYDSGGTPRARVLVRYIRAGFRGLVVWLFLRLG